MRERRRPPTLGSDGYLSGWAHAAVQPAPRTGSRGAPLAAQLSGPQGGNRDHLRTQSRAVASGQNRVKGPEEEPVIKMRRAQLSFGDGLIHEEVEDLREDWMITPTRCLGTNSWWQPSATLWRSGIPKVAAAAGKAHRPRWCCAY